MMLSGIPATFLSSPISRLGLLPGLRRKPILNESCLGESPVRPAPAFIPGRLNAAAEIFFMVVGVEGEELKFGDICGIINGGAWVMEGEGGVEGFRMYSGGVW